MRVLTSGESSGACDGPIADVWRAWIGARPSALGQSLLADDVGNPQASYRDFAAPQHTHINDALELVLGP